jgi:hypothetical protein
MLRFVRAMLDKLPFDIRSLMILKESSVQGVTELDSDDLKARIMAAKFVFVYGWNFRSPRLVKKHADKIREFFRPTEEYEQSSLKAVEPLKGRADVVVGVHIRQGDYQALNGGQYFFPISRYAAWMHEIAAQFPDRKTSFLVCSDEKRHASEFPGLSVGFGPGTPVGDLYALAKCDYIVGPLSTFSQWASFYGERPLFSLRTADDSIELHKSHVSLLEEIP